MQGTANGTSSTELGSPTLALHRGKKKKRKKEKGKGKRKKEKGKETPLDLPPACPSRIPTAPFLHNRAQKLFYTLPSFTFTQ